MGEITWASFSASFFRWCKSTSSRLQSWIRDFSLDAETMNVRENSVFGLQYA